MEMNITLLIQMLVFILFIWVTYRFVWPPLMKALETRKKLIADGLAAAEQSHRDLENAKQTAVELIQNAKAQSAVLLEQARQQADGLIEAAKGNAKAEAEKLLELAKNDVALEYEAAKYKLMSQVSHIAVLGAEKILQREIDQASNDRLVSDLVSEIQQ